MMNSDQNKQVVTTPFWSKEMAEWMRVSVACQQEAWKFRAKFPCLLVPHVYPGVPAPQPGSNGGRPR
jgi:hypothetical protein